MAEVGLKPRSGSRPPSKRPSASYRTIRDAIRARQQITCVYDDRLREACPHILGYNKLGQETVFVYQFAGESTSKLPNWRCLTVAGISDVHPREGRWHGGTQRRQTQTCIQFVDVDVNVAETLTHPQPLAFGSPELRPPRRGGA